MAHQFRIAKSLTRRSIGTKQPKPKILVICEGKITEPKYFQDFKDWCGNSLVTVTTLGGCGVPISVIERAILEKEQLARAAKASKNSFDTHFEVWAVFDRDVHPKQQLHQAIALAKKNNIPIAYSNPCFELWGLMHYSCEARPGHHHETQKRLKLVHSGYCHEKNPVLSFTQLQPKYVSAVSNSIQALKNREAEGQTYGDPSTTVHLLTERIRQFGRS